jgi:hypothetical protein
MNNNKKSYYRQNSDQLTLQEILNIVAKHTGSSPKLSGRSYRACCPAHDDRHASVSIALGDNGKILLYCFVGCTVEEICSSLGLSLKDLFPKKKGNKPYG